MPEGVGRDVEEVGEVNVELHKEGVSEPAVAVGTEMDEVVIDGFSAMAFLRPSAGNTSGMVPDP